MSLDTHGGSETGGVYSGSNTLLDAESGHSSDNPEHYDTPIYDASCNACMRYVHVCLVLLHALYYIVAVLVFKVQG